MPYEVKREADESGGRAIDVLRYYDSGNERGGRKVIEKLSWTDLKMCEALLNELQRMVDEAVRDIKDTRENE